MMPPSPVIGHGPGQSVGQLKQVSRGAEQMWSPQTTEVPPSIGGHVPQSPGHVMQVSTPLQMKSPHSGTGASMSGQRPQSTGQVEHFSLAGSQNMSPQNPVEGASQPSGASGVPGRASGVPGRAS